MIVTCEKCSARFRLADEKVGPDGAKVRCSKCQHTFLVKREEELEVVDFDDVTLVSDDDFAEVPAAAAPKPPTVAAKPPGAPPAKPPAPPSSSSGEGVIEWNPQEATGQRVLSKETRDALHKGLEDAETAVGGNPILFRKDEDLDVDVDFHDDADGASALDELPPPSVEFGQEVTAEMKRPKSKRVHEAETKLQPIPGTRGKAGGDAGPGSDDFSEADTATVDMGDLGLEPFGAPGDAPSIADIDPFGGGDVGADDDDADGLAGLDPFAAGGGGSLADELFSDLPDPEPHDEPMDPFSGVGKGGSEARPKPTFGLKGIDAPRQDDGPRPLFPLILNTFVTLVAAGVLLAGAVYFFASDAIRIQLGAGMKPAPLPSLDGVRVTGMRSVTYPRQNGEDVLVVLGNARNSTKTAHDDLFVVAELRNRKGKVLASNRAPVGLPLDAPQIYGLTNEDSLAAAYSTERGTIAGTPLPANGSAPFTVVILSPPPRAGDLLHRLALETGTPVAAPAPPPTPEPEAEPVVEDDSPRKGKRKGRKGKHKGRKGKRKRKKDAEE